MLKRVAELGLELYRRRVLRQDLGEWCRHCGYTPAKHHQLMIDRLEDVSRGTLRRLALFLPPGSAKSTYASVLYPPWYLAKHRTSALISASHTQELAERWGRRCRNLIDQHSEQLGIRISSDAKAAGRWETEEGGEYFAAGVGGAITGRRGDLVIIDDPVRSREDADSPDIREKTWQWWLFDLLPRLKPEARIVLIQTRWHEDDLAGRILAAEGANWEVVKLPMEAGANDPIGRPLNSVLWPEWFTPTMVNQAKRDTRVWSALYQQEPVPEGGDYFRAEWLHPVEHLPQRDSVNLYGASDYAVTSRGGDYTVHVIVGVDQEGRMYLMDLWRGQTDSAEWIESWCDMVEDWRPLQWAEEKGQINAAIGPFLQRRQRERRAYVFRRQFPSRRDKAVRAQSIRARMSSLGLYIPTIAPWRADFESELLRFPAGKHDDQVDALSLIGQLLDAIRERDGPEIKAAEGHPTGYSPVRDREEERPLSAADI